MPSTVTVTLVIQNNTPNKWRCELNAETFSAGFISSVKTAATMAFVTLAAGNPVVTALTSTVLATVGNVPGSALAGMSPLAFSGSNVQITAPNPSRFAVEMAKRLDDTLASKGFKLVPPGSMMVVTQLDPESQQRASCVRVFVSDQTTVRTEELYVDSLITSDSGVTTQMIQSWITTNRPQIKDIRGQQAVPAGLLV